jgi:hypothetical protein
MVDRFVCWGDVSGNVVMEWKCREAAHGSSIVCLSVEEGRRRFAEGAFVGERGNWWGAGKLNKYC